MLSMRKRSQRLVPALFLLSLASEGARPTEGFSMPTRKFRSGFQQRNSSADGALGSNVSKDLPSSTGIEGAESSSTSPDESSPLSSVPAQSSSSDAKAHVTAKASKRSMLGFAGPALGIYLSSPLMSNIDNAFVGRSVGTRGLAALSPGTICTDQMFYLFSFLARATTGLVSSAYGAKGANNGDKGDAKPTGDIDAAREAASAPLAVSLMCGALLTVLYALFTPQLMSAFHVKPELRADAASYIRWRGSAAWAALAQNACLAILMSTRDSITPLKIIMLASGLNVIGDWMLCFWPLRWGCAGAAAATAGATLFSSAVMVRSLKKKRLFPQIRLPKWKELRALLDYTGPLFLITLTRWGGFVVMQQTANKLGKLPLASYQLCLSLLLFFLLFGEPISQISQTQLPALIQSKDGPAVKATLQSALLLGLYTSLAVGSVAFGMVAFGSPLFSADPAVQAMARHNAPAIFAAVSTAIFTIAVDGSLLACRDFGFMLSCGLTTFFAQLYILKNHCDSIGLIFGTFTLRLGSYALLALARIRFGFGPLGKLIKDSLAEEERHKHNKKDLPLTTPEAA